MRNIILHILISPVCFLCMLSCSTQEKSGSEVLNCAPSSVNARLVLMDTIRIGVDSLTPTQHYYDQLKLIDGKLFYLVFNETLNTIQFYDLLDKKYVRKIFFEKEGPNGIGDPNRFYYHNEDSVFFIYYNNFKKVVLINRLGVKINTWNIDLPKPYESYWINGELFYEFKFYAAPKEIGFWISFGKINEPGFQKTIQQCRFNLQSGNYRFFGELPQEMKALNFYPNNYVNGYSAQERFISYYLPSHVIQEYGMNGNLLRQIKIKSKYLPEKIPALNSSVTDPDVQQEHNYNMENGFYVKMLTNEDNSFHYRIVKHPVALRYTNGKKRNFYDVPFSVILLDSGLNWIDEFVFEGGRYDFFHSFAYADKLYLSLNNPLNEISNDDEILFAVFEVLAH